MFYENVLLGQNVLAKSPASADESGRDLCHSATVILPNGRVVNLDSIGSTE